MQVAASRRDLREVRRIIEKEGEIKVCHVIIKCLVCTMVLDVSHLPLGRVHDNCGSRKESPQRHKLRSSGEEWSYTDTCFPFSGPGLTQKEAAQTGPAPATCL